MIRRMFRNASGLFAALGWALVAAWLLGRLLTDSWRWSQYVFWVPTVVVAAGVLVMLLFSWLAAAAGGRDARGRRRAGRRRMGLALALVGLLGHIALVDLRLHGYLLRRTPEGPEVRILNWNCTAVERTAQITGPVLAQNPDVAILVNPHSGVNWTEVIQTVGPPLALVWDNGYIILSRLHILRYGTMPLGLTKEPPPGRRWVDSGRGMWLELDTREKFGRTTMVWVVDIPSDWRLSRREMAVGAARAMATWQGVQVNRDELGQYTREPGGPGFPAPDIVLGDFNMPRGSGSLRLLAPGMENAYDQAGAGWAASWPRISPLVHIDQMFLGAGYRARRYEVVDPGFGYHRMQVGDIGSK